MSKRDGKQQGKQNHAEGMHGEKTRQAHLQQLHSKANGPAVDELEGRSETNNSQRRPPKDRQL